MLRAIILFLFLGGFATELLWAEPRIEASLSGKKVNAGATLAFNIQTEWPKNEGTYSFALPDLKLQNLTLVRQGQSQENYTEGDILWTRKIFTFELIAEAKKKEGFIEAFTLPYMDPETQKVGTFTVEKQSVRIHNPLPLWLWPIAGGVLALGFGIGGGLALRANKRKKEGVKPVLQEAAELGQIKSLMENRASRTAKEMLLELDANLRHFVTSYYQLGLEKGAGENQILERLHQREIPREELAPLEKLLSEITQAKFSASTLSESELRDFQREMIRYMENKKVIAAGTVS